MILDDNDSANYCGNDNYNVDDGDGDDNGVDGDDGEKGNNDNNDVDRWFLWWWRWLMLIIMVMMMIIVMTMRLTDEYGEDEDWYDNYGHATDSDDGDVDDSENDRSEDFPYYSDEYGDACWWQWLHKKLKNNGENWKMIVNLKIFD